MEATFTKINDSWGVKIPHSSSQCGIEIVSAMKSNGTYKTVRVLEVLKIGRGFDVYSFDENTEIEDTTGVKITSSVGDDEAGRFEITYKGLSGFIRSEDWDAVEWGGEAIKRMLDENFDCIETVWSEIQEAI